MACTSDSIVSPVTGAEGQGSFAEMGLFPALLAQISAQQGWGWAQGFSP